LKPVFNLLKSTALAISEEPTKLPGLS